MGLKATQSTLRQVVGGARGTDGVSHHSEKLWVNSTHFLSAVAEDCIFPSEKDSCGAFAYHLKKGCLGFSQ